MTEEEKQLVENFLEKQEVTEDFVIYADVYDAKKNGRMDHIDGNICVNEIDGTTIITIPNEGHVKADRDKEKNQDSVIVKLNTEMFEDGKLTDETVKNLTEEHPALADIAKEMQINDNLKAIAETGQKLVGESGGLEADYKNQCRNRVVEKRNIEKR